MDITQQPVFLQARLKQQEEATAEQSLCAQKLQEAVEVGKGKLATAAVSIVQLQDEATRAKEQISEHVAQVQSLVACLLSSWIPKIWGSLSHCES